MHHFIVFTRQYVSRSTMGILREKMVGGEQEGIQNKYVPGAYAQCPVNRITEWHKSLSNSAAVARWGEQWDDP